MEFDFDLSSLGNFGDSNLGDKAEAEALAFRIKLPNFSLVLIGGGGTFFVRVLGFGEFCPDTALRDTAGEAGFCRGSSYRYERALSFSFGGRMASTARVTMSGSSGRAFISRFE